MAFPSLFMAFHHLLVLVLLIFSFPLSSSEPPAVEKQALLSFFTQVLHSDRLTWNSSDSPCNWIGVQCDTNRIHVVSLRLPAAGLIGVIPSATLGLLADLRVLSLHSNRLSGPLPSDFANLTSLHSLFLHRNQLSGEFPGQLIGLTLLTRLDLSFNNFVGKIPASITNLTSLTGLFLQDNSFNGSLPAIKIQSLVNFNVSDNNLTGPIPATLSRFPQSSFAGNIALCGSPLAPCSAPPPPPAPPTPPRPSPTPAPNPPQKSNDRLSRTSIIAIAAASGGGLLLLLVLILLLCLMMRQKRAPKPVKPAAGEAGSAVATAGGSPSKDETGSSGSAAAAAIGNTSTSTNKLVFVDGGIHGFDLEDMLRASAEVLGKGSVGMTYKAVLEEGTAVAVKRLREVAVGKREFGVQMEALGKMRHDNVVAFRAYYYSKDEKLVVSDFMTGGSLSTLLHGNKGGGRTELDWDKRLSIAVAAGRGIAHLHSSGRLPHGNIKASNVLLHPTRVACVSDYGLNSVLPRAAQPDRAAASYRAPEAADTRKATFKSDVYSFGVLLLELLTGKAACGAPPGGEGADLPRWVETVVAEAWTEEVFDEEMVKGRRREGEEEEMVQLLQVAMACVAKLPDERPSMQDVVRMMEEVGQEAADVGREEEVAG